MYNDMDNDVNNNMNNDMNYNMNNDFNYNVEPQNEKANIGLAIVSFLIPLVGLILFIVTKDNRKARKTYGMCALISVILSIVFTVLSFILLFSAGTKATNNYLDNARAGAFADQTNSTIEIARNNCINNYFDSGKIYDTNSVNALLSKPLSQSPFGGTYNFSLKLDGECQIVSGCMSDGKYSIEIDSDSGYLTRYDVVESDNCSNNY